MGITSDVLAIFSAGSLNRSILLPHDRRDFVRRLIYNHQSISATPFGSGSPERERQPSDDSPPQNGIACGPVMERIGFRQQDGRDPEDEHSIPSRDIEIEAVQLNRNRKEIFQRVLKKNA